MWTGEAIVDPFAGELTTTPAKAIAVETQTAINTRKANFIKFRPQTVFFLGLN